MEATTPSHSARQQSAVATAPPLPQPRRAAQSAIRNHHQSNPALGLSSPPSERTIDSIGNGVFASRAQGKHPAEPLLVDIKRVDGGIKTRSAKLRGVRCGPRKIVDLAAPRQAPDRLRRAGLFTKK